MNLSSDALNDILRRHHHLPTEDDIQDVWDKADTDVLDTAHAKAAIQALIDKETTASLQQLQKNLPKKQHKYKYPHQGEAAYNSAIGNVEGVVDRFITKLQERGEGQ